MKTNLVNIAKKLNNLFEEKLYDPMNEDSLQNVYMELSECGGRSGHPADELINLKCRKDLAYIDGEFFANDGFEDEEV